MTKQLFITATDTDAGKTLIASALVYLLTRQNKKIATFKPVSAGCELIGGQLVNEDASLLCELANAGQPIENVNPIAYKEPIAPHIAAKSLDQSITVEQIVAHYQSIKALAPDYVVTEGAGGWRLPLGNNAFLSDFAKQTRQDVILVVNMKLGCLNHALLTFEAIQQDGLTCIGWIANRIEPMPFLEQNINELQSLLPCEHLGTVPNVSGYQAAAEHINISSL